MKKILISMLLLSLTSCGLFGGIDYGPAVQSNKGQAIVYEELRGAFASVIMSSKTATEPQKAKAMGDIEANRIDFYNFNTAQEQFLIKAGDIDPARILELAKEAYAWIKARAKDGGE